MKYFLKNKQIKNIFWMLIDKAYLLIGGFIISVMVARYLGPKNLGLLSYGLALGTLAVTVSQWGGNYTIFNTAAVNLKRSYIYIFLTEKYRLIIYIAFSTLMVFGVLLFQNSPPSDLYVVSIVMISQVFIGLDIYQYHYNATLQSEVNARTSIVAKTASMLLRFLLVYFQCGILLFSIPFFIEGFFIYHLRKNKIKKQIKQEKEANIFNDHVKSYFLIGTPLVITGICTTIYTRVYEVILANVVSFSDVGIYSTAGALNTAWTFFPMAIGISLLSKPMNEKKHEDMSKGYSFVLLSIILSSLPILTIIYFFSYSIISVTFGNKYLQAGEVLFILSIGNLFSTLGFINNRIISSCKGGGAFLMKKVIFSSIFMITFGYFLVDKYAIYGAGLGYMISELLNLTLFNYFFRGFNVFDMHLKTVSCFSYWRSYKNDN